jgi:hypothetical protein
MHDTQIAGERIETALRSGRVTELAATELATDVPGLTTGGNPPSPVNGLALNRLPEQATLEQATFEQVREKVQSDDKGKWDIVLPRSEVLMRDGKIIFPDAKAYECEDSA